MRADEIRNLIQQYRQRDENAAHRLWDYVRSVLEAKYVRRREVDVDDIVSHVVLQLFWHDAFDVSRCDSENAFKAWVKRVADNFYCDFIRQIGSRRKLVRIVSDIGGIDDDPKLEDIAPGSCGSFPNRNSSAESEVDAIRQYFRKLENLHEYVVTQLRGLRGEVDFAAVYCFDLRFWMYTLLRRSDDLPGRRNNLLETTELLIPWTEQISTSRFQPSWPPLGQIWKHITPLMEEGRAVDMSHVLNAAAQLNPSFNGNGPQYYQWRRRLRKRLQDLVTEEVIDQLGIDAESYKVWKAIVFCSAETRGDRDG